MAIAALTKAERQGSKGAAEGDRMIGWGMNFQVTGDGHWHLEFRCWPFGHQELAAGSAAEG